MSIMENIEANKFDLIIADFRETNLAAVAITSLTKTYLEKLESTGSMWLIIEHQRDNLVTRPVGFEVAENLINVGLILRNILVWYLPEPEINIGYLSNQYCHIYFFVKDPDKYVFIKDNIREKHIWKDVEWGKRESRYNSLGKDPSNFWLPTLDDGNGKITQHLPMDDVHVIKRIISATNPGKGKSVLLSNKINDTTIIPIVNIDIAPSEKVCNKPVLNICTDNSKSNISNQYKLIWGTSEQMPELDDNIIDLIVTSPPYWDMKDYNYEQQIGYQQDYSSYLHRINLVWTECYRVLKNNGSFWLNVNTKTYNRSIKQLQLDMYKLCSAIGFKLWDIILWHKSVSGPAPKNNLTDKFEYVLVFYKGDNILINERYEHTGSDYKTRFSNRLGNVWNINRFWGSIGKDFPHPAMYPEELVKRIINLGTKENEIILDPFMGSGSTMIAAKELNRSCVGYEINKEYSKILVNRFEAIIENDLFTDDNQIVIEERL